MLLKNYFSIKKGFNYFIMVVLLLFSSTLFSQIRDFNQLYPVIDRPVSDMKFSSIPGISEYGLLFALPGNDGGLAYFTNQDSLNIFSVASNLGAVSIVPDEENNRIFCAFGSGSNSDGLYKFDVTTQEFELEAYCEYPPHFVKKISSGFYFGYGFWNMYGGLLHSTNGDNWTSMNFFNFKDVTDVEENGDGTIFVSAGFTIYIENNGNFNSFETPLRINDIYIRNYPNNNEVYIACGEGSYSDAVYRVEYEDGEITGLTFINGFGLPNKIYEYEGYLVIGCIDYYSNLFLVEPEENGQVQEIGDELGINEVYCFEFYPIYTPNFMVGSNNGVFLATNLTSTDDQQIENVSSIDLSNYPNPFNPKTTIKFSIQNDSQVELSIYNTKGQKVKTLLDAYSSKGHFEIIWQGVDDNKRSVASGQYFIKLKVNGKETAMSKCVLLK